MKIAVIGAGISGLSMAQLLNKKHEVKVFEKKQRPGGLIQCERIKDCLFHKVGGHLFNSKNQAVLNWFWSFFNRETEFIKASRNAKVFFKNQLIGYPIENHIYALDKRLAEKITKELLLLQQQEPVSALEFPNFEAFLKGNFGDTLFEIYFKPYNTKIWKTDLEQVAMGWLEGKLPMPDYTDIILSNITREAEAGMVHASFFYPKNNGSQFIADRLSEQLDITTSFKLDDAVIANGQLFINGGETFDKIIYTGDIRKLPPAWNLLLQQAGIDMQELQELKANATSNLFCETDDTDISWLYIPENFTRAHRIIYTGNFSETNNTGTKRNTCVVEFSGEVGYDEMVEEVKLLPGHLTALSYNYEPNSYVVQMQHTRALIQSVKNVLEPNGIYLLGRFAEWEYYNMDKAMEAAFALESRI